MSLLEIRDRAVNSFAKWLDRHSVLFFTDADKRRHEQKQHQFKRLVNTLADAKNSTSIPNLLGFAFWAQSMLTMWGVNFGMGIIGDPVKSFYITNAAVDETSSRRLADALAAMLPLQFAYTISP